MRQSPFAERFRTGGVMKRVVAGVVLGFVLACGGTKAVVKQESAWPCGACELYDVQLMGDRAYVADSVGPVTLLDVSDPLSPVVLGRTLTDKSLHLEVVGDRLYVTDWTRGLVVYDVSNPSGPVELGATKAAVYFVEVKGDVAFTPGQAWDVSSGVPEKLGRLPGSGGNGAALVGDLLYVAASTKGFRIVDVSDPANARLLGEAPADYAKDVAVVGSHAFVAAQNAKAVLVFDVSNPLSPKEVARVDGLKKPTGVVVQGDVLYVADGSAGVRRFNVSDPTNLVALEVAASDSKAVYKVTADARGVFAADEGRLVIAPL